MGAREACCSSEKVAGEVKSPLCPDKRIIHLFDQFMSKAQKLVQC